MSQDDRPIFPRSTESSEEEKRKLREQARQSLENAEKSFEPASSLQQKNLCPKCGTANRSGAKFCQGCGSTITLDSSKNPVPDINDFPPIQDNTWKNDISLISPPTVYGPPPMRIEEKNTYNPPPYLPPPPAYGPPPMLIPGNNRKYLIWGIIVGGVVLLAAALVIILAVFFIFVGARV